MSAGPSRRSVVAGAGALAVAPAARAAPAFPDRRPPPSARRFTSPAVEAQIARVKPRIGDAELAWMFETCWPNTLDTTVEAGGSAAEPDTFVITGDIPCMWLRDSSAQVWSYLPFAKADPALRRMLAGVIRRQARCILIDPYANAFMHDPAARTTLGWAKTDDTEMRPGVAERKWEVDSLCWPMRLAWGYWRETGDVSPFDAEWRRAMARAVETLRVQQRLHGPGPYRFQREAPTPTETVMLNGYGSPTRKVGLIHSMFRPSDDACLLPFLIPSNLFAVAALRQLAQVSAAAPGEAGLAAQAMALAAQVEAAAHTHGRAATPQGEVWAYEVDGFGGQVLMDDANAPGLLNLPALGAARLDDPLYRRTRARVWSEANPYFFRGRAGEGIGGPHEGLRMVWPMSVIYRALTSRDEGEITACLVQLKATHAGTGFIHEAFDQDDPKHFTRPWFAWADSLFGELILKLAAERPALLARKLPSRMSA